MSTTESNSHVNRLLRRGKDQIDAGFDIIVAGGGVAGLSTALFARWLGDTVVLLEKSAQFMALPSA